MEVRELGGEEPVHELAPPAASRGPRLRLPRTKARRGWIGVTLTLVGLAIRFLLASHLLLGGSSVLDTCATNGMNGDAGKEGTCVAYDSSFGGRTTFNVVNSGHTLHMPGYAARLLAATYSPTHVTGPLANSPDYPNQQGLLVSLEVWIHNAGPSPLEFDQDGGDVDLMIAPASSLATFFARPQVPYPEGAPNPQLDQEGAIPAAGTATGWVSFVAPLWAQSRLNSSPTDLEFLRRAPGYVGRIRLWKAATPAGAAAMSFHQPPLHAALPAPTPPVGRCTETWSGGARDASYGNPHNWSTGRAPASGDTACIPPGSLVEVNTPPAQEAKAVVVEGTFCLMGAIGQPANTVIAGTPVGHATLRRLPASSSVAPPCPPNTGLAYRDTPTPPPVPSLKKR